MISSSLISVDSFTFPDETNAGVVVVAVIDLAVVIIADVSQRFRIPRCRQCVRSRRLSRRRRRRRRRRYYHR